MLGDGQHLGPLAGRIVMETVYAAIENCEISVVRAEKHPTNPWTVDAPRVHYGVFTMADLIAYAGDPDPARLLQQPVT